MSNLFKKAAICTDLHLGLKSNSTVHNEDCINFINWFVQTAKRNGCDAVIMMGDWHNNRANINIVTLNYSIRCLELLSSHFDQIYFIPGNHDLYYRDRRDIKSIEWAKHISNITIINDMVTMDRVTFCPWLVGDEHKKIKKLKSDYVFGHFELPHFYMNAMVQMPDHGEIKREDFGNVGHVYSGHFHKRQNHKNITYIGNCFPHNYADAGDDARGMMILPWGGTPEFLTWSDQPKYRLYALSDVLEKTEALLLPNMHVRVQLDIDISYEEANFIKETFITDYKLRELTLLPIKNTDAELTEFTGNVAFESVDQIVSSGISKIESEQFDSKLLLEIYNNL